MLERVAKFAVELVVRVVGLDACGDAIARVKYGDVGHFAVFAIEAEPDDSRDEDDDEDDDLSSGPWGDSLRGLDW